MNYSSIDYLHTKEKMHQTKHELFMKYQLPVISIVANIMGEDKVNTLSTYVVSVMHEQVAATFKTVYCYHTINDLGYMVFLVVDCDAYTCKKHLIALETQHACGRLVDCDVFTHDRNISRNEMHVQPRKCLLCSEIAKVCIRNGCHSKEELLAVFEATVLAAIASSYTEKVRFALISECMLSPKFGLVTPFSSGIHTDMDIITFLKSIHVLIPYFKLVEKIPIDQPFAQLFQATRSLGLTMEAVMVEATSQINTHKGAIFLFLCVMMAQRITSPTQSLSKQLALLTQSVLKDFEQLPTSEGLKQFHQYSTLGVRGFVTQGGEPLLSKALNYIKTKPLTQPHLVNTLLLIMGSCDDSTIIKKGGLSVLQHFQHQARIAFENPSYWETFETYCLQHHLSAGGAADILALVIYLHLCHQKGNHYEH